LLASGTAARARGDRAAAVAFFRQLQIEYPAAKESQVALVSAGQLLLDGGDFSGALAAFHAYCERASAGPLVEEALDGAARALAGLGRNDEERAVWLGMVARFPGSAYLPRATQRLRVLR
jgi:TolA-binding protein